LTPEEKRLMPALLRGLAYSQLRLGQAAAARQSFATLEIVLTDPRVLAEAHIHAFRAALKRYDWPKAISAYEEAARLDPATWPAEMLLVELDDVVPADGWAAVQEAAARLQRR
jgi:hypothetical protein